MFRVDSRGKLKTPTGSKVDKKMITEIMCDGISGSISVLKSMEISKRYRNNINNSIIVKIKFYIIILNLNTYKRTKIQIHICIYI